MDKSLQQAEKSNRSLFLSLPFLMLLLGHVCVDIYSFSIPSSLGVIEKIYQLTPMQSAWLLGIGSLTSGLAQPLFAWLSDVTNKRFFGGLGLAITAIFICCMGLANNVFLLFLIYMIGMLGNGMFHPIAASTIGQLVTKRRSLAVSLFFVAGMTGGAIGSIFGSRFIAYFGLPALAWFIVPGVVIGVLFHLTVSKVEHRHKDFRSTVQEIGIKGQRWFNIFVLYLAATLRFSVNMALLYLFVRLVEGQTLKAHPEMDLIEVSKLSAPIIGNLNGFMVFGMAIGGLLAGSFIRPGGEKWPLVVVPIVFAPAIGLLPFIPIWFAGFFTFLAGIGFASMVPISVSVAQRLLPEHTSLASGIMLGGAWALGMLGPRMAELIVSSIGLDAAFYCAAFVLMFSGLIVLVLNGRLVQDSQNWNH